MMENHLVNCHGNGPMCGVPGGCKCARLIDQLHDPTTVDIALAICMFRLHHLGKLNPRRPHSFSFLGLRH
jgi:hypothetical protein